MRIHFLIVLIFATELNAAMAWNCPMDNVYIQGGRVIGKPIRDVRTWGECGYFCSLFPENCHFWNFNKNSNLCYFHFGTGYPGTPGPRYDDYISGDKYCY